MKTLSKAQKRVLYAMHKHGCRLLWNYPDIGPHLIAPNGHKCQLRGKTLNLLIRGGAINDGRDLAECRAYELTPSGYEVAKALTKADFT